MPVFAMPFCSHRFYLMPLTHHCRQREEDSSLSQLVSVHVTCSLCGPLHMLCCFMKSFIAVCCATFLYFGVLTLRN